MNKSKLDLPEKITWNGLEFNVTEPTRGFRVLTATLHEKDASYQSAVPSIIDLNQRAVSLIRGLRLSQFRLKQPVFTLVIVPAEQFQQVTRIPDNFSWATVCSRRVWWAEKGEDAVVTSSAHTAVINFDTTLPLHDLSEKQADVIREATHEHLPTLKDTYLRYPSVTELPFSEAMDETVPRLVLGLQTKMPQSTQFLASLDESQILTVEELWNGFSKYSSSPVSYNHAYGSAFLLGAGILMGLRKKYGMTNREALSLWLETMMVALDGREVVTKTANALGRSEKEVWNGKKLQKEGQEVVSKLPSMAIANEVAAEI